MPTIYGEGKDIALKRLEMTVKGFTKGDSELKDLKGTAYLKMTSLVLSSIL
jgi:hypothetical protein